MKTRALIVVACLSGCAAQPVSVPRQPVQPSKPMHVATREMAPSPPPLPPRDVGIMDQAKRTTDGAAAYVAKPDAAAPTIKLLTVLTRNLDQAVATMKSHERRGRYRAADVVQVRAAIDAVDACIGEEGQ